MHERILHVDLDHRRVARDLGGVLLVLMVVVVTEVVVIVKSIPLPLLGDLPISVGMLTEPRNFARKDPTTRFSAGTGNPGRMAGAVHRWWS